MLSRADIKQSAVRAVCSHKSSSHGKCCQRCIGLRLAARSAVDSIIDTVVKKYRVVLASLQKNASQIAGSNANPHSILISRCFRNGFPIEAYGEQVSFMKLVTTSIAVLLIIVQMRKVKLSWNLF